MFIRAKHLLTVLSAMALLGCRGTTAPSIAVEGIRVTPSTLTLHLDETARLSAAVTPENATDYTLGWRSDNPIVAAVSDDGTVTAVSLGETVVHAVAGPVQGDCRVNVVPTEVSSVTVTPATLTLTVGQEGTLAVSVLPEDATDRSISWSSSDETLAMVSQEGVVTALAPGKVTIAATANNGVKGQCEVLCKAPFSFVVEMKEDGVWKDASQGIVSYPSGKVDVRLSITEGEGKTFTWTVGDGRFARYAEGQVQLLTPGKTLLTVEASDGQKAEIPLESSLSETFVLGSASFAFGTIVPVGNKAENLVRVCWNKETQTLPIPVDAYTVSAESALVDVSKAEDGFLVKALGEAGEALLRLKIGEWVDQPLCTLRISGKWASGTEPLDGEELFPW